jgi:hypothetical protein
VCRYYVHADQCPGWVPLPSPIVGSYDEQNRTYEKEYDGQGRYYKDLNAYAVQAGVCYISEPSDRPYTHADFLQIAHGNSRLANYLFESVNWQSPETLFNDLLNAGEITKEGVFVE